MDSSTWLAPGSALQDSCVSDVLPPDGLDKIERQGGDGVPQVPAVVCQQGNLQQRCMEYPTLSQNKKYNHFKSW